MITRWCYILVLIGHRKSQCIQSVYLPTWNEERRVFSAFVGSFPVSIEAVRFAKAFLLQVYHRFTSIGRYLFCTCMSARHVLLPGHELIMAVTQICQSRERLTTSRTFCQLLLRSKDQRRDFYKGICLSLPCWSAVTAVHVRWRTIAPMDLAWINMKTVISDY